MPPLGDLIKNIPVILSLSLMPRRSEFNVFYRATDKVDLVTKVDKYFQSYYSPWPVSVHVGWLSGGFTKLSSSLDLQDNVIDNVFLLI